MIKVTAVWYADTEEQADAMTTLIVEKYKVAVSYKTEVVEEDNDE